MRGTVTTISWEPLFENPQQQKPQSLVPSTNRGLWTCEDVSKDANLIAYVGHVRINWTRSGLSLESVSYGSAALFLTLNIKSRDSALNFVLF